MRISRITVYQLDLPLNEPYWLSGGRLKFEMLDTSFVHVETDEGVSGWGEGCPWGHSYLPAHGPGIRAGIETLAPFLLGEDPRSLDHINRVMDTELASSTPQANRLASWLCHYHLSADPVPGQGARNIKGSAIPPSMPGLGVSPDVDLLGAPVAVYQ